MFPALLRRTARRAPDGGEATTLPVDRLIALRGSVPVAKMQSQRGTTHLPGLARTRFRGRGLEFDDLRPYAPGDDVRHIDWNVTARTGRPFTRQYREERERALTVAVDLRPTMFTGSERLKAVAAGELAAALVWRTIANRDRAAVLAFDDEALEITRPASRERGATAALGALSERFAAARDGSRLGFENRRRLEDIVGWINRASRSAGTFLLLTDLEQPGASFEIALRAAAQRGNLAIVVLRDPIELAGLPPGAYRFSAEGGARTARLGRGDAATLARQLADGLAGDIELLNRAGIPALVVASAIRPQALFPMLIERGMI